MGSWAPYDAHVNRLTVAIGALLLASLSCNGGLQDTPIARHRGGLSGNDAEMTGQLVLEDGCLLLIDEFEARWLPLFPKAATWDDQNQEVRLEGTRLAVGSRVGLGGGVAFEDLETEDAAAELADIPWSDPPGAQCRFYGAWWVGRPRALGPDP